MKLLSIFLKIVGSLLVGLMISLYLFQNDIQLKRRMAQQVAISYAKYMGCNAFGHIEEINFYSSRFIAHNLSFKPSKNSELDKWSWDCQKFEMTFSWIDLLIRKKIYTHVKIFGMTIYSEVEDGKPLISNYLSLFFNMPTKLPMRIKSFSVSDGKFIFNEKNSKTQCTVTFNSESGLIGEVLKTNMKLRNGICNVSGEKILDNFCGSVRYNYSYKNGLLDFVFDGQADISKLDPDRRKVLIGAQLEGGVWKLGVYNRDRSFVVSSCKIIYKNGEFLFDVDSTVSTSCLSDIANFSLKRDIDDLLDIHINGKVCDGQIDVSGRLNAEKLHYEKYCIEDVECEFKKGKNGYDGSVKAPKFGIIGSWTWHDKEKQCDIHCKNKKILNLDTDSYWRISPGDLDVNFSVGDDLNVAGSYSCVFSHAKLDSKLRTRGSAVLGREKIQLAGEVDDYSYEVQASLLPDISIEKIKCSDSNGDVCIDIRHSGNSSGEIKGDIHYPIVRKLLKNFLGYDLSGRGLFCIDGCVNSELIQLNFNLKDGNIRLPRTYNFIKKCSGSLELDIKKRSCFVRNLDVGLHRGDVSCERARVMFSPQWDVSFAYIPICLNNCFLNLEKDFFVVLSGNLNVEKKVLGVPVVSGYVFLGKSQFMNNIFSSAFESNLVGLATSPFKKQDSNIELDLHVATDDLMRVETSFLNTKASCELWIKKSVYNPEVTGTIELEDGTLYFPYKHLNITNGSIHFLPGQNDPMVELTAKNKLKRYNVTLRVEGSLSQPHILLESYPSLTEEQIIALLIAGAEGDSLNVVVPALIMQNLKSIVFSQKQTKTVVDKYFNALLKPLKHIRLVPKFSDQTGRGGFRGAIEIDVNDRLRGMIEKNFNLSEDTRFEVEYLLADEVGIKAVKDERGDIGGELEMRWKF